MIEWLPLLSSSSMFELTSSHRDSLVSANISLRKKNSKAKSKTSQQHHHRNTNITHTARTTKKYCFSSLFLPQTTACQTLSNTYQCTSPFFWRRVLYGRSRPLAFAGQTRSQWRHLDAVWIITIIETTLVHRYSVLVHYVLSWMASKVASVGICLGCTSFLQTL